MAHYRIKISRNLRCAKKYQNCWAYMRFGNLMRLSLMSKLLGSFIDIYFRWNIPLLVSTSPKQPLLFVYFTPVTLSSPQPYPSNDCALFLTLPIVLYLRHIYLPFHIIIYPYLTSDSLLPPRVTRPCIT